MQFDSVMRDGGSRYKRWVIVGGMSSELNSSFNIIWKKRNAVNGMS